MPSAKDGGTDGGVSKRMAGSFMTQLQDIKEPVFWCFTANSVDDLHEAFLADDRVDCVVYVGMPGPDNLAAGWQMHLKISMPVTLHGKPFELGREINWPAVLAALKRKRNDPVFAEKAADRAMAALMCLPTGTARNQALAELAASLPEVHAEVDRTLINDTKWTVARIKAVCRLARKREMTLAEIAQMMPRHQKKLDKVITRLEKWAVDEAIDAETGRAYVQREVTTETDMPAQKPDEVRKARRTVRRLADD